jgi:hypothetical protein
VNIKCVLHTALTVDDLGRTCTLGRSLVEPLVRMTYLFRLTYVGLREQLCNVVPDVGAGVSGFESQVGLHSVSMCH